MISLTTRSKEAIKTGLAMAITYGIALQAGWDKPFWAGFAVAMISLSTAGQSLNKGAMRMLGTLVGLAAWCPRADSPFARGQIGISEKRMPHVFDLC